MSDHPALAKSERLLSLDVFRGITIAGMILVNNPGSWGQVYGPLGHAKWHGWTPTDLVFPFFLFIVGVAITFSFDKRLAQGFSRARLFEQVVRRTIILFCLGLIMYGFWDPRLITPYILIVAGLTALFWDEPPLGWPLSPPARLRKVIAGVFLASGVALWILWFDYFQQPHAPATPNYPLRIPGVLQRIAVCYFLASIIVVTCGIRGRVLWTGALILGYWWLVSHFTGHEAYTPANAALRARPEGWLHDVIDIRLLGAHLYTERPDPEGVLSTVGALATTLLGVLAGNWLHARRDKAEKTAGLFFAANALLFAGLCISGWMPINKKIWTSSYVLLAGGLALHLLAMCYWLIDVKGVKRWAWPFMVFGTNAILVFVASGLVGRILAFTKIRGGTISIKDMLYREYFVPHFDEPINASLAWAIIYVLCWFVLLIPLYRRRWFLKI